MLHQWKRGLSAVAAFILLFAVALPVSAADPLSSGGFAKVRISAQETDTPEEELSLAFYQRDDAGTFQKTEDMNFITPVNRVSKDVELHLIPQTQGVTLTIDYLTDLNSDGVYEWLDDSDTPVHDILTAAGSLTSASSGISTSLSSGTSYTITATQLLARGRAVIADRTTSGSASYLSGADSTGAQPESILYMITVSYHSASDNADYELCYYLRLYEQLPAPSAADYLDVSADAWYYEAVDYVVSHGYLSGTTRSLFSPEEPLTRAMLAQILYQVAGAPESGVSHFQDVPDDAWCYAAVSWITERGIMSGNNATTFDPDRAPARQELAAALYRFAQNAGLNTEQRADLSAYSDADQVASWARASVEWSVSVGLLTGYSTENGMLLSPTEPVNRAEFSAVLRTLCETVLPQ